MHYPKVLSEDETLDLAISGRSIARLGDGELRIMCGGTSPSQAADKNLARELQSIVSLKREVLPCIPNLTKKSPKYQNWMKYTENKFMKFYIRPIYGSAFISRPDSAPWIDRTDYWEKMRSLWKDKDVVLVAGSDRSLTPEKMPEAKSIRVVKGTYRDSYAIIDRLMEEIGRPSDAVLICLGAAGTVLAARLADLGVHAIDLGHAGQMLKNACTGRWNKDASVPVLVDDI